MKDSFTKKELGGNEKNRLFGNFVDLNSISLTESAQLNNFEFRWGRIEEGAIGKVGAAEMKGDKLWYVNQNSPQLIDYLSLKNKISHNGGIKAIFSLGETDYAYVAYVEIGCASARIINLTTRDVVLQLPCISNLKKVNLNNVGGGWIKLSEREVLLAIGAPTTANVGGEINQLAQSDKSFWGKILRLEQDGNKLKAKVFTKGHRNAQGIAQIGLDLVAVEQGPRGGDEINLIIEGSNYGWPYQSLGSEYDLTSINKSFVNPILSQIPLFSFVPSIGISSINNCPQSYIEYYAPNKCLAVSSMRGNAIYFIVYQKYKTLFTEKIDLDSRIRKLFVEGDVVIGLTDYEGVIVGNIIAMK
jgi:hypothetical protein